MYKRQVLLQFYDNPTEDQRRLLEQHEVQLLEGVAPYTAIVSVPADTTPADLLAESGLRWMGSIPVENKYDKYRGLNVPAWARTENGGVKLEIHFYEDVNSKDSTSIVKKYSGNYSTPSSFRPWVYRTIMNETNITLIASEDAVQHVGYFGEEDVSESDFVDYDIVTEEEAEITEYTFENYGGEVYTPEPMEFGANLTDETTPENTSVDNSTERKYVYLQFYSIPTEDKLELLEEHGVKRVGVAAEYTYIFSMPADLAPADLPAESGLRWMGPVPVENKYDPNLGLNVPEWARTEDGQVEIKIYFYDDVTDQKAQLLADRYSSSTPELLYYSTSEDPLAYGIVTEENNITSITSEDIVKQVFFPEPETSPVSDSTLDVEQSSEVNQLPGFESPFSILLLLIVFVFVKRREVE